MTKQHHPLWQELLSNLREQRRHVHALIRLAREQTLSLAEADVERLEQVTQQQASHLDEIDQLESRRREIVHLLGDQAGLHAQPPTLSDCAHLAPEHVARTLRWLQQELLHDVRQLQELNERNREIIQSAAETVHAWLAVVVSAASAPANYSSAPAPTAVVVDTEV
ncbi:MAG: flagellar protein FlgN [Armatimonadota bacterium]|nr:flagellar protein FlgN [Armatimonadota bacterium]